MLVGNSHIRKAAGVALLEVLIAVVVLAVGLFALASFQGNMLRSGSHAHNRTIATNIAQEEMEQARAFEDETGYGNIANTSSSVTRGNAVFNISRTVTDYYFAGADVAATTTVPAGASVPDYKMIQVAVSWTDQEDNTQQIMLESYVNASTPADSGKLLTTKDTPAPSVSYTPGSAPAIIAIEHTLGGTADSIQEASTPEPEVDSQSGTVQVSFEEVNYKTVSGTSTLLNRDEYRTINCVCRQGRSDSQNGLTPATFEVNEDGVGDDTWVQGTEISNKNVGRIAVDQGPTQVGGRTVQLSKQPDICDICCRDHHDGGTGNSEQYDPFRPSADYTSGDHNHYFPSPTIGLLTLANNTDDLYLENCRFIRHDGIWRVAQDWRAESLQVLPANELSSASEVALYSDYVKQLVKEYVLAINTSDYPTTTPDPSSFTATDYVSALAALPNEGESNDEVQLNAQSSSEPNYTDRQVARAIYIDYMDSEWINRLKCKINGSGSGCTDIPTDTEWLAEVPFHDVNVTFLANWSTEDPATIAIVNSEDIDNAGYDRGLLTAVGPGTTDVMASLERSNSGLTDTRAIDFNDDCPFETDELDVTVTGGSAVTLGHTISGIFTLGGSTGLNESDIEIFYENTPQNVACQTVKSSSCVWSYSCTLPQGETAANIIVSNYSYEGVIPCGNPATNTTVTFNNQVSVLPWPLSTLYPTGAVSGSAEAETTTYPISGLTGNALLSLTVTVQTPPVCP